MFLQFEIETVIGDRQVVITFARVARKWLGWVLVCGGIACIMPHRGYAESDLLADEVAGPDLLTVDSAVRVALQDNPGLAQMQARYLALAQVPDQVGALPDPLVEFGALNFPTDTFDRTQESMTQLRLGVSQVLPFPGKRGLRRTVAILDLEAAGFSLNEARLQLVRSVTLQWWRLHYTEHALQIIRQNELLLGQFIEIANTKYATGKGLQQDVLLAQLELSKLFDRKIQLNADRQQQAIELNILMNRPPDFPVSVKMQQKRELPNLIAHSDLYQLSEGARPRMRQMHTQVVAARTRLDLARKAYYPDFKVGLAYGQRGGRNATPAAGRRADFFSVSVGVEVPLWAGRKQTKAVSQRALEVQSNRYALNDERALIRAEIASSVTAYQRARRQLSLFESGIVPQAEQTVKSMLAGYQVSEVDFLNLIRSQMTLFEYQLRYWLALSEAHQALADIQAAVGEGVIYE